jgi:hypothetical protein
VPAQADLSECGCGSCGTVTLAELQTVIGADGMPYSSPVRLVGVETQVEWATIDRTRKTIDDALTARLEALAEQHRADTWHALRDGWQPGERDEVRARAVERYAAALQGYASETRGVVAEHAQREMDRQVRSGVPFVEAGVEVLPGAGNNIDPRITITATEIASRVQGEVESAWAAGMTRRTFGSRISPAGLSLAARAIGNVIESRGRLDVAQDLAQANPGLVVTGVIRSSVRDRNRCRVCAQRHGTMYDLPRQMAEFEAMPLPDPDCEGRAERCRCGWLIEWGRRG